jgi:hypothetical protein
MLYHPDSFSGEQNIWKSSYHMWFSYPDTPDNFVGNKSVRINEAPLYCNVSLNNDFLPYFRSVYSYIIDTLYRIVKCSWLLCFQLHLVQTFAEKLSKVVFWRTGFTGVPSLKVVLTRASTQKTPRQAVTGCV